MKFILLLFSLWISSYFSIFAIYLCRSVSRELFIFAYVNSFMHVEPSNQILEESFQNTFASHNGTNDILNLKNHAERTCINYISVGFKCGIHPPTWSWVYYLNPDTLSNCNFGCTIQLPKLEYQYKFTLVNCSLNKLNIKWKLSFKLRLFQLYLSDTLAFWESYAHTSG